jgi:cytidylate kinase
MSRAPIIAIDGPSGSGKGTVSRAVAAELGWRLLDSGALYRLVALAARKAGAALEDGPGLARLAERTDFRFGAAPAGGEMVWLDGADVTLAVRTETAGNDASKIAALPELRAALLQRQRDFAEPPGLVADGRDMGTVVFPTAEVKIFLTASAEELAALSTEIAERDRRDTTRSASPLVASADAVLLDTTGMSVEAVVGRILEVARGRLQIESRKD